MKVTRTGQRRAAAINSVKILLTSASLAATVGGWAAISAANGSTLDVAQLSSTTTVQAWLASRGATAANTSTSSSAANQSGSGTTNISAVTAQVVVRPNIRTRSSR